MASFFDHSLLDFCNFIDNDFGNSARKYILDNLKEYYDKTDVSSYIRYAAHAKTAQFYKGIERGLWECQRIVNEIKGRLAVEQEHNE